MLLYELCTGRNLFECDVYENVTNEVLVGIARWSDEDLVNRLQPFKSLDRRWPVGLLAMRLNKDPSNRPCDWNVVIRMLKQSVTPIYPSSNQRGDCAFCLLFGAWIGRDTLVDGPRNPGCSITRI